MEDVREAVALILADTTSRCWFIGERPEALVRSAEKALGFELPPSYRRFVLDLGAGSVGAEEIYGVTTNDFVESAIPNGIWLTLDAREDWGLPDSMVIISFDGGVDYYVLDCRLPDPEVLYWRPGITTANDEPVVAAASFGAFLLALVVRELDL